MPGACESILETIGRTPLVRIRHLNPNPAVELWAKWEGANPAGSVKERIARSMVEGAERRGELRPGMTLVESSSGNTGIGLAMVAAVKGYPLVICMPMKVSVERRKMLRAFGAEVRLTSPQGGSDEAWDLADALAASDPRRYFRIHQYRSPDNARAHYEGTGPEIWEQTDGRVSDFVVGLGTCGTIMGAGRFLRERRPGLRIWAVEPCANHRQQGLRNLRTSRVPEIYDPSIADEVLVCQDEPALHLARELALREGLFAGISSGSALWGAQQVCRRVAAGGVVVVLLPDGGEKYLSTELYAFPGDPVVNA